MGPSQGKKRYLLPETHSVIKKTTHMQETVITHMALQGILLCGPVCVRVCVSVSVDECMGVNMCV